MMKSVFFILIIASAISIIHAKEYRIMIFGGGPAGLETARKFLTLRETNPKIKISKVTIIEKRRTPTRTQVISLKNKSGYSSIVRFPQHIQDQLFNSENAHGCFFAMRGGNGNCVVANVNENDVIAKTEGGGEEKLNLNLYAGAVKINKLEEILRDEVKNLGGEIIYTKESFVQEDGSIYADGKVIKTKEFDLLVCADGSNSGCRKTLFKDTNQVIMGDETKVHSYTFINVIPAEKVPDPVKQLKVKSYTTGSTSNSLAPNRRIRSAIKNPHRMSFRHGCLTSKQGAIYVGTQISANEWNKYQSFFNRPVREWIETSDMGPAKDLKNELRTQFRYCSYGDEEDVEELVNESHLTAVPVRIWHQQEKGFARVLNTGLGKVLPVVLIGDSAAGVHYFSGTGINIAFAGVDILISNFINGFSSKAPIESLFTSSPKTFVSGYNMGYFSMLNPTGGGKMKGQTDGLWLSRNFVTIDPEYSCDESKQELTSRLINDFDERFLNTCSHEALCYISWQPKF